MDEDRRVRVGDADAALCLIESRPDRPARPRRYAVTTDRPKVADRVAVQLNRGDEAGDEERLRRIVTVLAALGGDDEDGPPAREVTA